jgi:ethanolamine transporter EutH
MKRAVRVLIRVVAAGLLVFGGMEIGLEYMRHRVQKVQISLWHCVISAVLVALGVVLFAASARLAEQFTDDIDE